MNNAELGYKRTTIVFPRSESGILLGMKKRGFGEGWWNGFGGKLEAGETYEDSAKRETLEEAGVFIKNLIHIANLVFYFDGDLGVVSKAYVAEFTGEPRETEEMRPKFFEPDNLPFEEMWPADKIWVPKVLAGSAMKPMGFVAHFENVKTFVSIEELEADQLEELY